MKKIHISNITEIKNDRIYYSYNDDSFCIDLEQCANNYESTHNILNKNELKARCVGERYFGLYAFYELYTDEEHTQIYMELKTNIFMRIISKITGWNFYSKDFQKFYAIHKQLNRNGWTSLDLS